MNKVFTSLTLGWLIILPGRADEALFHDDFKEQLGAGWFWVRENRGAWRVSERGLEVRVEPGNLWGQANDAKNILLRPAPETVPGELEITVTIENHPTRQYEQVNLSWYYDDRHMVKLGQELVDGKMCIVMGREAADRPRTVNILPLTSDRVKLRYLVSGNRLRGQCQPEGADTWQEVGECDLPAPENARPKISLQFYQGPADAEHWARVTDFRVRRLPVR